MSLAWRRQNSRWLKSFSLLGEHSLARQLTRQASAHCLEVGDRLGRAQALLLAGFMDISAGSATTARHEVFMARSELEALGYRLGMAQADATLAHIDHLEGNYERARSTGERLVVQFRELGNPRGEAACERLLGMIAIDEGRTAQAERHAESGHAAFERLGDGWGQVECLLLIVQAHLLEERLEAARAALAHTERFRLDEAEPQQHRWLTRAWLAKLEGNEPAALADLKKCPCRLRRTWPLCDHCRQLLQRLTRFRWSSESKTFLESWLLELHERRDMGDVPPPTDSALEV
jgi:hypothetical protein